MLAEHGIAHYAMHTNYDVAKMAELAGARLHLQNQVPLEQTGCVDGVPYGIGCIGEFGMGTDSTGMLSACERSVSASACKAVWRKGNEDKKSGGLPWIRKEHDR